jgi:YegS/Rv2252/BmrU family lipid kinase
MLEGAASVLTDRGWNIDILETQEGQDLTKLAGQAVADGVEVVLVAGGDGSVGRVASVLANSSTALGVLPAGTANVWAKELGLPHLGWISPLALEEAARRLARGSFRQVDLGECGDKHFMLWAGIGLDGKIVNSIEPRARWEKAFAVAHYAVLAVWESLDWQGIDMQVRALGKSWQDRFLLAVASNIRAYAGGFIELSPAAKIDDGLLDFWLLRGSNLADAVPVVAQILMGRPVDSPEVIHFRAEEATFEAESDLPIHFDGDPVKLGSSLHFKNQTKVLKVLIPEGGWPRLFSPDQPEEERQ